MSHFQAAAVRQTRLPWHKCSPVPHKSCRACLPCSGRLHVRRAAPRLRTASGQCSRQGSGRLSCTGASSPGAPRQRSRSWLGAWPCSGKQGKPLESSMCPIAVWPESNYSSARLMQGMGCGFLKSRPGMWPLVLPRSSTWHPPLTRMCNALEFIQSMLAICTHWDRHCSTSCCCRNTCLIARCCLV